MKKVKFLALVMVFAIMLMGVGYAAWTDRITVATTVQTGEFDVDFTAVTATTINEPDVGDLPSFINPLAPVLDANAVDNGDGTDRITLTAGNLYPGSSFEVIAKVTNRGTIPSILKGITTTLGANAAFLDVLRVNVVYDDGNYTGPGSGSHAYIPVYEGTVSGLNNAAANLLELGINPLDINDFDEVILTFTFPFDTPAAYAGNEGYFENITSTFDINFDWVQFNDPAFLPTQPN